MKILIHHHAMAYPAANGFYVQSFIGWWVKELSKHFDEVGVLLQTSAQKTAVQDTFLDEANIKLYVLPTGGGFWDHFSRKKAIAMICQKISPEYDILLIRGITPRQWTVWKNCVTPKKAFLLVGSIRENKPRWAWSRSAILMFLLGYVRYWEYKKITQSGIMLANSPHLVQEIADVYQQPAHFISTNTIREVHIKPLVHKPIGAPCTLLFCGRVIQEKGIEELILALGLLNRQRPNAFQLQVIGIASPAYKTQLEQLAEANGVTRNIVWSGFVPFGTTLLDHYYRSDFMVLPTFYNEGFPHAIWEAAVSSTSVVVTSGGGIPGLMDDSLVTFIVAKSAADIEQKINMLLENAAIRAEKVTNLYHCACGYTVEVGVQKLADILAHETTS